MAISSFSASLFSLENTLKRETNMQSERVVSWVIPMHAGSCARQSKKGDRVGVIYDIAKLKSFHQNDSVQPKKKQQTKQGGDQHLESAQQKPNSCFSKQLGYCSCV